MHSTFDLEFVYDIPTGGGPVPFCPYEVSQIATCPIHGQDGTKYFFRGVAFVVTIGREINVTEGLATYTVTFCHIYDNIGGMT